jgi:hypothetical protein
MKRIPRKWKKIIKCNNGIYRFDKEVMKIIELALNTWRKTK